MSSDPYRPAESRMRWLSWLTLAAGAGLCLAAALLS
jgi:hypothetical protein